MNHEACGFVDHDNVFIGVNHIQGDVLSQHRVLVFRDCIQAQHLTAANPVSRLQLPAIDSQCATPNPFLKTGSREIRKQFRRHLVQALSGLAADSPGRHRYSFRFWRHSTLWIPVTERCDILTQN
jgi:hypothetical protein